MTQIGKVQLAVRNLMTNLDGIYALTRTKGAVATPALAQSARTNILVAMTAFDMQTSKLELTCTQRLILNDLVSQLTNLTMKAVMQGNKNAATMIRHNAHNAMGDLVNREMNRIQFRVRDEVGRIWKQPLNYVAVRMKEEAIV